VLGGGAPASTVAESGPSLPLAAIGQRPPPLAPPPPARLFRHQCVPLLVLLDRCGAQRWLVCDALGRELTMPLALLHLALSLLHAQSTAYDRAYSLDPVPGPGSYENESDRYGLGSTCVLQGPKSDNSFRDFSSSFGTSQRSSIVSGGPIDAKEVLNVAPTEYHISTQFDDLLASSSFAASSRRIGASNKGLHSHYTTNKWMHDTKKKSMSGSQRLPRIPGVETLGGTSSLAQTLTGGSAPVSGTAPGVKHVVYMRERQKVVPNARPRHMH